MLFAHRHMSTILRDEWEIHTPVCIYVWLTLRDAECDPSSMRRGLMILELAACTFTV